LRPFKEDDQFEQTSGHWSVAHWLAVHMGGTADAHTFGSRPLIGSVVAKVILPICVIGALGQHRQTKQERTISEARGHSRCLWKGEPKIVPISLAISGKVRRVVAISIAVVAVNGKLLRILPYLLGPLQRREAVLGTHLLKLVHDPLNKRRWAVVLREIEGPTGCWMDFLFLG